MEIVLAILAIGISIGGLALGLLVADKPLRGSCGGTGSCDTCKGDASRCETASQTPPDML